jgi:NADH-quinone oxidoreductase subunit J
MEANWLQIVLGSLIVMTALLTVLARNPVISAISLMATLLLTGGLYFNLGHFFVGAAQILIYAGAISVLFIFIVMLLDLKPGFAKIPGRKIKTVLASMVALFFLFTMILSVLPAVGGLFVSENLVSDDVASAKTIALQLLSKYMIPFQVTVILLLAAVMGVTIIGKQTLSKELDGDV